MLTALVITIIVLLILAGVSIMTLTGDNGLLNRTTAAKDKTEMAGIEEEANLMYAAEMIDRLSGNTSSEIALGNICEELKKKYNIEGIDTVTPTVESVTLDKNSMQIAKGRTGKVEATVHTNPATKLWYAIVDGKYYRIKIEDGKVKIEKTETANPTGTGTTLSATYSSDNAKVSVDTAGNIEVDDEATGTAIITAEAGGKTATCEVTIVSLVESITATIGNEEKITEGATANIQVTTSPASGVETLTYTYTVEEGKSGILTVSEAGEVQGLSEGTAKITVRGVGNGTGTDVSYELTVTVEVLTISYITWEWNETSGLYTEISSATKTSTWSDYGNGKWGNIKTTKNGITCYWVWIPRFAYKVADLNNSTAKEIDVEIVNIGDTVKSGYIVHPAFKFGTQDLEGFWVAKFEASAYNTSTNSTITNDYGGGNSTTYKVQVKPGVQSWRYIDTKKIFTVCKAMTESGGALEEIATDSHMMKNSEWGAVAIFSQSKYGIYNPTSLTGEIANGGDGSLKVWINPNGYDSFKKIFTGYVGTPASAITTADTSPRYDSTTAPTSVASYNSASGPKASTTGTIYGVYDMAGGSWEYVAGCYSSDGSEFGTSINSKYYDVYGTDTNKTLAITGWNSDYSEVVSLSSPVFRRGGNYAMGVNSGIFNAQGQSGSYNTSDSFRPVWVAP